MKWDLTPQLPGTNMQLCLCARVYRHVCVHARVVVRFHHLVHMRSFFNLQIKTNNQLKQAQVYILCRNWKFVTMKIYVAAYLGADLALYTLFYQRKFDRCSSIIFFSKYLNIWGSSEIRVGFRRSLSRSHCTVLLAQWCLTCMNMTVSQYIVIYCCLDIQMKMICLGNSFFLWRLERAHFTDARLFLERTAQTGNCTWG